MITADEAKQLLAIISRANFSGGEVEAAATLKRKLMTIMDPEGGKPQLVKGDKKNDK